MRRLPPFAELVAFEAVARHLSFTRAAAELCITQSAVSHRIRRLENYLGAPLVRRLNPGLALTEAGAAMLPPLTAALDGLARLGGRPGRLLRVAAGSALCTWWLASRLSAFANGHPGLSVELVPIENDAVTIPEVDVRILWVGEGEDAPDATRARLVTEQVFPVCSPRLLPGGRPQSDVRALETMTLLHKATHATGEWSWDVWLDRLGIDARRRGGELRFADMSLIVSAAINGSGVALARSLLVHDALREGRLVIPVAGIRPMVSSKVHVARWRRTKAGDPDVDAFVRWLAAEAKATLERTNELVSAASRPGESKVRSASVGA